MSIEEEIEKWQYEVEYWTRTLNDMPKDTWLGRKCVEYYFKRAKNKLNEALEKKNKSNV